MSERNGTGSSVIGTIARTIEANTSRSAFGEPIRVGDVTIIAAARVSGRGGGGGGGETETPGEQATGQRTGEGGGGGLVQSARPVGALVVKDNEVSWRPALDLNRIILGGQIVAVVALLVVRSLAKQRRRRRRSGIGRNR